MPQTALTSRRDALIFYSSASVGLLIVVGLMLLNGHLEATCNG